MKAIVSIGMLLILCRCQNISSNAARFEREFNRWETEGERQLQAGLSWIIVDKEFTKYLVAHAHEHELFLKDKLKDNMFVYQILGASDLLNQKYGHPAKESTSVQEQQAAWLKALKGPHNKAVEVTRQ